MVSPLLVFGMITVRGCNAEGIAAEGLQYLQQKLISFMMTNNTLSMEALENSKVMYTI